MSKATYLQRTVLNAAHSKYVTHTMVEKLSKPENSLMLNEAVSKDEVVNLLDQILEYSTRSKKDIESDNTEMLKVDLAQIVEFAGQLEALISDKAPAEETEVEETETETKTES